METILQGLLDLAGVNAALVLDGGGRLVAFRGKAVYDRSVCEQVGGPIAKAIDSIALQQQDWDAIAVHFADGKLLLRSLGAAAGRSHVLAVVADATLNPSFATVAIRVAANKLKPALEGGGAAAGSNVAAAAAAAAAAAQASGSGLLSGSGLGSQPLPLSDSPVVAQTGVSWSKTGSSANLTGIQAADPASAAFLSRCTKELARTVGPMAKVYVQEAVRRLSPDATYSMALKGRLLESLAGQIEDAEERAQFVRALEKA